MDNYGSILNMFANPMEFDVDVPGFCFRHGVVGEMNRWEIVAVDWNWCFNLEPDSFEDIFNSKYLFYEFGERKVFSFSGREEDSLRDFGNPGDQTAIQEDEITIGAFAIVQVSEACITQHPES